MLIGFTDAGEGEVKIPIERLAREVEALNESGEHAWCLPYTCGSTSFEPGDAPSIEELLDRADESMYRQRREARAVSTIERPDVRSG